MNAEEERRIAAWNKEADEILESVRHYEQEHPRGAICLHPLLMVLESEQFVATMHGEKSPLGHVYPNAGTCGKRGCVVLHDDAANPIHPEDLTKVFHERTGRCFGGNPQAEIHIDCADTENDHRNGDHDRCLPVEDGATEPKDYVALIQEQRERMEHAAVRGPLSADRGPLMHVTVARCGVRIDMGLGDVQQCERPEDFRHEQHRVEDYNGSPLIWMEDHPRSRSRGEVTAIEVPGIRVEYGPDRVRTDWESLTGDQKMQARLDGTEYREPTLEERVANLETRMSLLERRPSPFDVIGDR